MFKNFHFKVLALIFAVTFWAVIVTTENTYFILSEKSIPQVFNVDTGLAVAGGITPVAITVRTSSDIFRQLTSEDFKVSVDATNLTAGEYMVDVLVTTKKADVSIVNVEPAQVFLKLEKMAQVSKKVVLNIKGTPAKNYAVGEINSLEPTITVSGAESVVSKVAQVQGTIQLANTETTNFVSHVLLEAVDNQGNKVPVTITPAEIDVIVPILQVVQSKTVGVKVNVKNTLENTFIESVEVDPEVISITGDANILQKITYIETQMITPQKSGINSRTALLILPEGVTVVDNEYSNVNVTIIVSPLESISTNQTTMTIP